MLLQLNSDIFRRFVFYLILQMTGAPCGDLNKYEEYRRMLCCIEMRQKFKAVTMGRYRWRTDMYRYVICIELYWYIWYVQMELWRREWGSQSIQTLEISEFLLMQSDWMKYIILDYIRWSFGACWNWKVDVCKLNVRRVCSIFSATRSNPNLWSTAERCPRRTWGMPSEKAQACDVERCWKMEDVKSESERERYYIPERRGEPGDVLKPGAKFHRAKSC